MKRKITSPGKSYNDSLKSKFTLARITFLIISLLLLAILALPVGAQDPVTDDDVNAIAKELFCPICESTPLDVCATQACADWRQVIRDKLGEGQTEGDIKAYFLDQYGARALADPPRSGITLWVWIMPILVVLFGGIVFIRFMRQARRSGAETAAAADQDVPPVATQSDDDDYRSRIESELRDM